MERTRVMLNDDEAEEVDDEISCAVIADDKEKLISSIHTPGLRHSSSMYNSAHDLLLYICNSDAVDCATSLLDGDLAPVIPRLDVNRPVSGFGEIFPLHYAARRAVPRVIHLFLSRGAPTDTILYDPLDRQGHNGLLPLEIALDVARVYMARVFVLPSTFQLITSLCVPRMKHPLEAIKLLAWYSKNIEKKAYYYAMEGKLAEFAVLLAVARQKVLVPITFSRQDGDGWNGSMTLHQWLKNEFGSLHKEEYKVLGSFAEKKASWIQRRKRLLKSIALLLEVFGRAGKAIEEYIQLERHSEDEEEKDVALRLVEAGCRFKDGDFDFNIGDWVNSGDSIRSPTEYLGTGVPFVLSHLPVLPEWNFPSRNGIIPGNGYGSSRPTYPSKRTHSHVPKSNFGSHYSNSSDVQVKNLTKTMEQGLPKYLSREKLPYISMLIKKGIRSV